MIALMCALTGCKAIDSTGEVRPFSYSSKYKGEAKVFDDAKRNEETLVGPLQVPKPQQQYVKVPDEILPSVEPECVELLLSATPSMMGFVDTPILSTFEMTISSIESALSIIYPGLDQIYYRVDAKEDKEKLRYTAQMRFADAITDPSFFLIDDMIYQPTAVKLENEDEIQHNRRMVRFMKSYYSKTGLLHPQNGIQDNPIAWSIENIAPNAVTLIIGDLCELQMGEGRLMNALQKQAFSQGLSVGIVGVQSEFSGFVPVQGSETVYYEWGDQPSGSPLLDFVYFDWEAGLRFTVPLAVNDAQRGWKKRPFYIIALAQSEQLRPLMEKLKEVISTKSPNMKCATQVYESEFTNTSYSMQGHVQPLVQERTDGILAVDRLEGQEGLVRYQLQGMRDQNGQRKVGFEITYVPRLSDTRSETGFSSEDFVLTASATADDTGEVYALEVTKEKPIKNERNQTLRCEIDHPMYALPPGNYTVSVQLALCPPNLESVEEAFQDFSGAPETFDGSVTTGFGSFLGALNDLHSARLSFVEIGGFSYHIAVVEKK